jgi:polyisoprenoid-binding protein YceI
MWLIALLAALVAPAFCSDYSLQLTPANTRIEWTLPDVLHTIHGTFELRRGSIRFDPDSGSASGEVVVDTTSGDTGGAARDMRMHKSVLQSSTYPETVFTPDHIDGKLSIPGTSNLKLHGMFKLHGAGHELTMDIQTKAEQNRLTAEITFDVPYVAWGLKNPSNLILKVAKTVQVAIHATAALEPYLP